MKQNVTPNESIMKQETSKKIEKLPSKPIESKDEIKPSEEQVKKVDIRQTAAESVIVQEPSKQQPEKVEEV